MSTIFYKKFDNSLKFFEIRLFSRLFKYCFVRNLSNCVEFVR